uniref:Transmembrane 9 superfamily member n=1 Tax=Oncorhynchus tshawytscha TaxID=74940 RepID=A0AAZ3P893_ONCTS
HNPEPQGTYHYYMLSVCRPRGPVGEVLDGDRMSPCIKSNSGRIQRKTRHCQLSLTEKEVDQLREAIEELRYFEFVLDDIPIWGFVGYMEESGFLPQSHKEGQLVGLWTHLDFNIMFNGDSVIFANVSVKDSKPTLGGGGRLALSLTYSVHWFDSPLTHAQLAERLRDYSFFPKTLEIYLVLVVLLLGFVIILTRVLKNDSCSFYTQIHGQSLVWNILLYTQIHGQSLAWNFLLTLLSIILVLYACISAVLTYFIRYIKSNFICHMRRIQQV